MHFQCCCGQVKMVSFGYKAFYVENLSLAEQNPACSLGQPWPGEQVVLCTLSLCTTGSPVWPWWQNLGALLTSTDGPVLEACTEDASCPPLPLFLPSVAFPFPKGFFPFFLLYNPTAMPSPAAFPSCIRRLTHCSAQLGCTSLPWDMGPHGCRQGLGLAHSEARTQLRAEASARVPPSLPLPRSFKLRCDGSAFLLPPRMAAAVTPQAFGHGLFNICSSSAISSHQSCCRLYSHGWGSFSQPPLPLLFNLMLSSSALCKGRQRSVCRASICTTSREYKMAPNPTFPH